MSNDDFPNLVRAEMDRTGLDEITAAKIVSGRLAEPGASPVPATPRSMSNTDLSAALTAPPTANEPPAIEPPAGPVCPACNGAGWYLLRVPYGDPQWGKLQPCACTKAAAAQRTRDRQLAILRRLDDELGSDLRRCLFESFDPARGATAAQRASLAAALGAALAYVTDWRGWLYLWGPCGVGKSHLAAAIAHTAARQGRRVAYASAPKLLRYIKAGIGDRSSDERLLALQAVDLLILDDLGAEYHARVGDFGDQVLFEIINERYLYDGRTVITSNLPLDDIETRIGSRIKGRARVVFVDGADQRGTGAS